MARHCAHTDAENLHGGDAGRNSALKNHDSSTIGVSGAAVRSSFRGLTRRD